MTQPSRTPITELHWEWTDNKGKSRSRTRVLNPNEMFKISHHQGFFSNRSGVWRICFDNSENASLATADMLEPRGSRCLEVQHLTRLSLIHGGEETVLGTPCTLFLDAKGTPTSQVGDEPPVTHDASILLTLGGDNGDDITTG